jgi:DNA-binding MarR family transcriptional regulator
MAWAVKQDLPAAKKCLLLIVANNASGEGWFFHSYKQLAGDAGLSKRSAQNYMKEFEDRGLIQKKVRQRNNGSFTTNEWCLSMSPIANAALPPIADPAPPSATAAPPSTTCSAAPAPLKTIKQSDKTIKKKELPKELSPDELEYLQMAESMLNQIRQEFPSTNSKPEAWADAIRKLREIDKHDLSDILGLWLWCRNHEFWKNNVRSPLKFRERDKQGAQWWDRLSAERNAKNVTQEERKSTFDHLTDVSWAEGLVNNPLEEIPCQ